MSFTSFLKKNKSVWSVVHLGKLEVWKLLKKKPGGKKECFRDFELSAVKVFGLREIVYLYSCNFLRFKNHNPNAGVFYKVFLSNKNFISLLIKLNNDPFEWHVSMKILF